MSPPSITYFEFNEIEFLSEADNGSMAKIFTHNLINLIIQVDCQLYVDN